MVRHQLVDLYLAKFSDIANALALQGMEVHRYAGRLEINNSCEWFVQKTANRKDRELASLGLGKTVSCQW